MKKKGSEPTIKDVARQAGVSIATVSRVLNDSAAVRLSTAQKVTEAMDALGYPRELPAAGRVNQLVIAVLPNLSNPF